MKFLIGSKITHPSFGEGVIFGMDESKYRIYFKEIGEKELAISYDGYELIEAGESTSSQGANITMEDIVSAVENVFERYSDQPQPVEIADKWDDGTLVLKPGDDNLAVKEIPISTFFGKIISVREKLRVLEQNINNHNSLNDSEKLHLQQYISRAYGSLTTFNVMFTNKSDHFSSK